MEMPSIQNNFKAGINFYFTPAYKGNEITLHVISDGDRYTVLNSDKPIGHIKLGEVRHTWYVVDSNYTAPYLVDEVGNMILAYLVDKKAA
jgi:hypothetical protein